MARRSTTRAASPRNRPRLPLDLFLRRRHRLKAGSALAFLIILLALALSDRQGWLTTQDSDWARYESRTFLVGRVVDGDTLDVDAPDNGKPRTRVRLWGIDTPEMRPRAPSPAGALASDDDHEQPASTQPAPEPWATQATQRARDLADGRLVTLQLQSHEVRDRYGRLLAYVRLPDGQVLNERLLLDGLARADRRFPHQHMQRYILFESQAQRHRLGLWSTPTKRSTSLPLP